jgi:hypothetical protein
VEQNVRAAGKQSTSVQGYSLIVVEKDAIVRDCKRIEWLRVIKE